MGFGLEVYIICSIIAVIIFFLSKGIFRKIIKSDSRRNGVSLFITVILVPVIYLALIRLLIFWIVYTPKKDFDKTAWKEDRVHRFEMSDDIINRKIIINKDTNEVKGLLGEPFRTFPTSWSYDMGEGGGALGFMFHTLSITFRDAKAIKVYHHKVKD